MQWLKLYADSFLDGSVSVTMALDEQAVWVKLMCLASNCKVRDGTLRHGHGLPMPRAFIAERIQAPLEVLNRTIEICRQDRNEFDDRHRIEILEDGTIKLTNWDKYQNIPGLRKGRMDTVSRQLAAKAKFRRDVQSNQEEALDALEQGRQ